MWQATGAGQLLSAAPRSDAEGLKLLIEGGALGPRGAVDFSRGLAYQLDKMITSFLESDGILDSRTDGIQGRVDDIEDKAEALDAPFGSAGSSLSRPVQCPGCADGTT